jgi:hypothetical protein
MQESPFGTDSHKLYPLRQYGKGAGRKLAGLLKHGGGENNVTEAKQAAEKGL